MTTPSTSREPGRVNSAPGAADEYAFRAPRHGDLVVCPYCDADTFNCDHCGGERRLYGDEVFR